jgi:lysine-N-methylase
MAPFSTDVVRETASAAAPLPAPAVPPEVTTEAVEAFACIADRCEDSCCRDWAVTLDRPSLDGLKRRLGQTPEGRDQLVKLVVIGRPNQHARSEVQIQMNNAGACPLLEPDNLCSVHRRFGEQALSTTCSVFPRTSLAVADRLEVNASLGCPEVARQVLLAEAPQHLRPASKTMLPRAYVGKTVSADPNDAYAAAFLDVRALLRRLFRQTEYPVATRLIAAAQFADRVGEFFFAKTAAFAGVEGPLAERRLDAEMADAESPALLAALRQDLDGVAAKGGIAAADLVTSILRERLRLPHSPRFAALIEACLGAADREDAATRWERLGDRAQKLQARLGAHSALVFANYADHFLLRHPYTDAPTLLEYLGKLAIHLGALRLLVLSSPELGAQLEKPANPDADRACFDAVVVHAAQTLTKAITHQVDFLDIALASARGPRGMTFARMVMFAKLVAR